jgi:ubiquinone/menaquinone biosynthesis C-methylase UbiE
MDSEASAKKQALQGVFNRAASTYAGIRYFPLLGQWLVDMAQIPAGAHVLDVACGRGAVLFPAARAVGPHGQVTGIDLSDSMAQETGAAIRQLGLTQASALQMDAEQLDFPDASFDYVLCGFSLQFFPHLERALSEFRRVLRSPESLTGRSPDAPSGKPAGRVAVSTWGGDDPRWGWFDELRQAYGAMVKLGSQSLDQPDDLFARFSRAGFTNIQTSTRELDMVYADEEEWWMMQWSISVRAGLEKLGPERLAQFKAEVFERMQAQKQADGFHDLLQAHCTLAIKP